MPASFVVGLRVPLPSPSPALRTSRRRALGAAAARLAGACLGVGFTLAATAIAHPSTTVRALLAAAGPPAPANEVTFAELEDVLRRAPLLGSEVLSDGRTLPDVGVGTLQEQLGGLSCGTPLYRAAERLAARADAAPARIEASRAAELARLVAGPQLSAERTLALPALQAVVRYETSVGSEHGILRRDADRNLIPDAIDGVVADVRDAAERLARLTQRDLPADLEIVIASSPFAEGFATTRPARIVAPLQLRGAERLHAIAHQLAHVLLRDAVPDGPDGWEEAVATWLGAAVLADVTGAEPPAATLVPSCHPARTFLSPTLHGAREDADFLRFVAERLEGSDWAGDLLATLPRHLEERTTEPALPRALADLAAVAAAMDDVLARRSWSLEQAVAEHQALRLEEDLAARGPAASIDVELDALPSRHGRPAPELAPFGQLRHGVQVPASGGLLLSYSGPSRARATAVALLDDGTIQRHEMGTESRPLRLATGRLVRVVVLVGSTEVPDATAWGAGAGSTTPGEPDIAVVASVDPSYPFVLTELSTEVAAGQVLVNWETASEEDVAGWWVERAVRPGGPWTRLGTAPFPAMSLPGSPAGYALVDDSVQASSRYHYRVRAVTRSGLDELTPAVAARTLPSPR